MRPDERAAKVVRSIMDAPGRGSMPIADVFDAPEMTRWIAAAIREGVAAEREAMARLILPKTRLDPNRGVLETLAAAIRARGES